MRSDTETAMDGTLTHYARTMEAAECSDRAGGDGVTLKYMVSVTIA